MRPQYVRAHTEPSASSLYVHSTAKNGTTVVASRKEVPPTMTKGITPETPRSPSAHVALFWGAPSRLSTTVGKNAKL